MSTTSTTPGAQAYVLPLTNTPQQFAILLAGVTYTMTVFWNDMQQFWAMNLADINNVGIVSNIPFITGVDLLDGLDYLDIGGSFYIATNGSNSDSIPTLENLGVDSFLYFVTVNTNE